MSLASPILAHYAQHLSQDKPLAWPSRSHGEWCAARGRTEHLLRTHRWHGVSHLILTYRHIAHLNKSAPSADRDYKQIVPSLAVQNYHSRQKNTISYVYKRIHAIFEILDALTQLLFLRAIDSPR